MWRIKTKIFFILILFIGLWIFLRGYNHLVKYDSKKMKMIHTDNIDRSQKLNYYSETNSKPNGKLTGKHNDKPKGKPSGVYFLKVHKCGGTTLQSILLRYGLLYNMTIAMPCSHQSARQIMGIPEPLKLQHIIPLSTGFTHYDLITQHTRYSRNVHEIMTPGTPFVAILRDPVTHFQSLYSFFGFNIKYAKHILLPNDTSTWKKFIHFVDRINEMPELVISPYDGVPSRNPQLYNFGFTNDQSKNLEFVRDSLKHFESHFQLVMLIEHFEESLVLLRSILRCDLRDLVSLKSSYVSKHEKAELTLQQKENILKWNAGDKILYDHFNKTFWRKIEQYGFTKMSKDVAELQKLVKIEGESCRRSRKTINDLNPRLQVNISLRKQKCELYNSDIESLERFVRLRMTKSGFYNISLAQRTCKYPPTLDGQ